MNPSRFADVNAAVAGHLRDLAYARVGSPQMYGYKRAAAAIMSLDTPLTQLAAAGPLPRIPGIGPASLRVIREVLDTGESPTVEHAIDTSGQRADVERRRALRHHFLSRAEVLRVLADPAGPGPTAAEYLGDLSVPHEGTNRARPLPLRRSNTNEHRARLSLMHRAGSMLETTTLDDSGGTRHGRWTA